jgi:hypothetical protein
MLVPEIVLGGDGIGHTGCDRVADRGMEGVAVVCTTLAVVAPTASEAHVRDLDVVARIRVRPPTGRPADSAAPAMQRPVEPRTSFRNGL